MNALISASVVRRHSLRLLGSSLGPGELVLESRLRARKVCLFRGRRYLDCSTLHRDGICAHGKDAQGLRAKKRKFDTIGWEGVHHLNSTTCILMVKTHNVRSARRSISGQRLAAAETAGNAGKCHMAV